MPYFLECARKPVITNQRDSSPEKALTYFFTITQTADMGFRLIYSNSLMCLDTRSLIYANVLILELISDSVLKFNS